MSKINEYLNCFFHIILYVIHKIGDYNGMDNIESFTSSVANIIVVIAGIFGIFYCSKLKERQMNATFSYLAQLQVRVKSLYDLFEIYQDSFTERLYIPKERRSEDINNFTSFKGDLIEQFSSLADETLNFLKQTDEQMPACREWPELYTRLIAFLNDMRQISNKNYHKWLKPSEETEQYKKIHANNMKLILDAIEERQNEITKKIFHYSLLKKWFKNLKSTLNRFNR